MVLMVALAALTLVQDSPPQAVVEGRVANSAGAPLANATVALLGNNRTPAGAPPSYRATTDASGAFTIEAVEPNTYRLFVQRTGYLEFVYQEPDGKVAVSIAGDEHKKVAIKMTAPSFVSGRVTTEDGEPFPGARVNVFRLAPFGMTKRLTALSPVSSGPGGAFTIGSLVAGKYYLAAANPPSLTDSNQREVRGSQPDVRYVTTYYPSAIDPSIATLVDVPAEAELHNLDIRLRKARVFHIAGKIVQPAGTPAATITLIRPGFSDAADPTGANSRVFANEGAFQVNALLPGAYAFHAWAGASRQWQGHQTVVISDRDIDSLALILSPALEIPLSVRIEDAEGQQFQTIAGALGRFTLTASDGVNLNAMADAKPDGTWMFHSIGAGRYRMGLGGPDGTYVKSIRYGDRDITRGELDTTSGGGALVMTLSTKAADVAGVVTDSEGKPLAGVTVTLWVPGPVPPGTLDQSWTTRTDASGAFRFTRLGPGEYRVASWESVEPGLPFLHEFHSRFDAEAATVKLDEGSHEKVQAPLISRQKVAAVAAMIQ